MPRPVSMLCLYRPKPGKEAAFEELLRGHWSVLRKAKLATSEPATLWLATGRSGKPVFVERFAWRNERAADEAHRLPEVMALWGPMEALADDMDFLELTPLAPMRPSRRSAAGKASRTQRKAPRRGG